MFNVQDKDIKLNFEMIELKSHAGAVLDKLVYIRGLNKLDDSVWDYTDDDDFVSHLTPVFEYLNEDTSNIHNIVNRFFLNDNYTVINFALIDHMIHTIDTKILQIR